MINRRTHKPLASVVTAVFNGASHVCGSLLSVLQQDSVHLELVVVDDLSTDASRATIRALTTRSAMSAGVGAAAGHHQRPAVGPEVRWGKGQAEARLDHLASGGG